VSIQQLVEIFHHRWAAPVLAELSRTRGARFVLLARRLGIANESLRRALDALIQLGLVQRNPGYGHPLRPEYLLTRTGTRAGRVCARLLAAAPQAAKLRKWSIPTVAALREERRFSELRTALPGVSPRALALALKDLQAAGFVEREVLPGYPPSTMYRVTASGRKVQRAL
jgi:DNA-binding HxlR family transcriptional regulator